MLQPSRLIKHMIVVSTWFSLPSYVFFLDTIEETYNMDPPLSIYPKKSPFRPMCCLLWRFLAGPLGSWVATVRPPGNRKISATQHISRPKRHAKSMLFEKLREMGHLQSPGGIIFAVKDILSKYE
jgi:hypothetical protein